jgi:hypothetical protein
MEMKEQNDYAEMGLGAIRRAVKKAYEDAGKKQSQSSYMEKQ